MPRARATPRTDSARSPDPADAAAFAAVRARCRRDGGAFYFASHFLPRAKRDAACALYVFCRMIDEAIGAPADDPTLAAAAGLRSHPAVVSPRHLPGHPQPFPASACGPTGSLDGRVAMFRERLGEVYAGEVELPSPAARSEAQHALHAFALTVRRFGVPREYFLEYAEGRRADLAVTRYATWRSLERHCHHAGGVVGLMAAAVLGLTHSDAGRHAGMMGRAVRLTHILRDVKRDNDRGGRVYLPLEDMAAFRYGERDLAAGRVNENFRNLMRFEVDRARRMYREAAEGLCWLAGDAARMAAATFAVMSAGTLSAIERERYDVFTRRPAAPTPAQALRRLPQAWRLARREAGQRVPDVFR